MIIVMPSCLRVDKGTETVDLATMHSYLINKYSNDDDATDCVIYGPSTENKRDGRSDGLVEDGDYDREDPLHRCIIKVT